MVSRALLGSIATLVLAFPVTVHAQAAAESALTNALSSSATLKAGSALNRALNQSSSQLRHPHSGPDFTCGASWRQQSNQELPKTEFKNPNR